MSGYRKSSSSGRPSSGEKRYSTGSSHQQSSMAPSRQGPGLMGQMAATGAGVAAGSVIGHGISRSVFGGREESSSRQDYQQPPPACVWELEQFLTCALGQQNLSVCESFNEVWKQCRRKNGL